MSQSFFERLAGRFQSKEIKASATFAGLVSQVADGQDPDLATAETVLAAAGKTATDLAAAVDRLRTRRQARATLDRATAAPAELRRITANLAAADAKREQAVGQIEDEYAAAVTPLFERQHVLERLAEDGRRAELALRSTAHEPPQLAELREQLAGAKRERDRHLERAGKAQLAARDAATAAQAYGRAESNKAAYREEAERQMVGVEQHVVEAQPFVEQVGRLQKEIEKVESLALTP